MSNSGVGLGAVVDVKVIKPLLTTDIITLILFMLLFIGICLMVKKPKKENKNEIPT